MSNSKNSTHTEQMINMTTEQQQPTKILLRGPLLSMSGYGTHARQFARYLQLLEEKAAPGSLKIVFEILPWGMTHFMLNPALENGLIGYILDKAAKSKVGTGEYQFFDYTFQVQLPDEWNVFLGNYNVGITAGVETTKCNPAWIDCLNRMDMVIVPSEFTKTCFTNTGTVTTRVEVVPEAYPESFNDILGSSATRTTTLSSLDEQLADTHTNFLFVGQFTGNNVDNDRKNIPFTIKWLAECLAGKEGTGVVLKVNSGAATELDKQSVRKIVSDILREVRKSDQVWPKFTLVHGHLTDEEMVGLYTHPKVKAMVSLTHGEGYGLPLLEQAVCGKPIIATNWSGHTEFLNKGKWLPVEHRLGTIHQTRVDNKIFMPDAQWAFPSEQAFKKRVLKFLESPEMPTRWAGELAAKLCGEYSLSSCHTTLSSVLPDGPCKLS